MLNRTRNCSRNVYPYSGKSDLLLALPWINLYACILYADNSLFKYNNDTVKYYIYFLLTKFIRSIILLKYCINSCKVTAKNGYYYLWAVKSYANNAIGFCLIDM